jgi:HlyD family secretion protein
MSPTETSRRSPTLLLGIIVAIILAIFLGVKSFTRDVVEIRVAEVNHQNLVSSVSTNGKVEPIGEFQAHATAPGVVQKIYVEVGEKVKTGQLLIKMDDADASSKLATATANLRSAEVAAQDIQQGGTQDERLSFASDLSRAQQQKVQAESDLATLKELQKKGAASTAEVAAAEQRLLSATASVRIIQQRSTGRYSPAEHTRANAQIADAQAAVAAARIAYDSVDIRSPRPGTVYSIPVSEYDFVPAGEDLLDVADLNHILVRAYFDEPEIGRLAAGQAVKIVWDAKPGQVWHGHIEQAPTTVITYGTRNVGECIITVDDAREDLSPNSNVTVTVTTSQAFNVLSIPRDALHTEGQINYVFRVIGGKLVRTPVQIGVSNLTRVEITSGLTEKDTVALSAINSRDLLNGLAVKIVE